MLSAFPNWISSVRRWPPILTYQLGTTTSGKQRRSFLSTTYCCKAQKYSSNHHQCHQQNRIQGAGRSPDTSGPCRRPPSAGRTPAGKLQRSSRDHGRACLAPVPGAVTPPTAHHHPPHFHHHSCGRSYCRPHCCRRRRCPRRSPAQHSGWSSDPSSHQRCPTSGGGAGGGRRRIQQPLCRLDQRASCGAAGSVPKPKFPPWCLPFLSLVYPHPNRHSRFVKFVTKQSCQDWRSDATC